MHGAPGLTFDPLSLSHALGPEDGPASGLPILCTDPWPAAPAFSSNIDPHYDEDENEETDDRQDHKTPAVPSALIPHTSTAASASSAGRSREEETASSSTTISLPASGIMTGTANSDLKSPIRCFFHSTEEVPLLRQWFASNPKPTEQQFNRYADILNQGVTRIERLVSTHLTPFSD